jgi:hypothetical protein
MEIIPCTHENHSMDPWKSLKDNGNKGNGNSMGAWKPLKDNGNKGNGNYNLHGSDYFYRCMEFLHPFHTVEISSRYMETLPWQTMIPSAFLQCVYSYTAFWGKRLHRYFTRL